MTASFDKVAFSGRKNGTECQCFPGLWSPSMRRVEWPRQPIPGRGSPKALEDRSKASLEKEACRDAALGHSLEASLCSRQA